MVANSDWSAEPNSDLTAPLNMPKGQERVKQETATAIDDCRW